MIDLMPSFLYLLMVCLFKPNNVSLPLKSIKRNLSDHFEKCAPNETISY